MIKVQFSRERIERLKLLASRDFWTSWEIALAQTELPDLIAAVEEDQPDATGRRASRLPDLLDPKMTSKGT